MITAILVAAVWATVTLSGPDDDGNYGWYCSCAERDYDMRPIADAIAAAEVHLTHQCTHRPGER